MGDVRVGDPGFEPVSTATAKDHLRIDAADTTQDTLIGSYVAAARESIEEATHRALASQTRRLTLSAFPVDRCGNDAAIVLPRSPAVSVTSIQYRDTAGGTQTLSSSLYVLDASALPGRITPAPDAEWPDTQEDHPAAVTVLYVCGPADTASVPKVATAAILLAAADLYENREGQIVGTIVANNETVKRLVGLLRVPEVY
jgi:uncharacterized phiE125 gp8 family phage protein